MDGKFYFSIILTYFQVLGMSPISKSFVKSPTSRKNELFLAIWSLVSLSLVVVIVILVFRQGMVFFEAKNTIGQFNDMAKFITNILAHATVIVEAFWQREERRQIWLKLYDIDNNFEQMELNVKKLNFNNYRRFWRKFLLYVLSAWLVEIFIIARIQSDQDWAMLWYANIFSLMVSRSIHLQHAMIIDCMTFRFEVISNELKKMISESKSLKAKMDDIGHIKMMNKIKCLKDSYNSLYEVSLHVNNSFSYSQVANFMQNFIQLTSDFYWIYSVLYRNRFTYIIEICVGLLPTFVVVALVLDACERCLNEVRFVGYYLHNIENDFEAEQFDILIENFSLQILHEPFAFSVLGFFDMDFTLLRGMVAAITTYMVIFIQFMPKLDVASQNGTLTAVSTANASQLTTLLPVNLTSQIVIGQLSSTPTTVVLGKSTLSDLIVEVFNISSFGIENVHSLH